MFRISALTLTVLAGVALTSPAQAIDLSGVKIDLNGVSLPQGNPAPARLHPYTEDVFRKWVAALDEDFATLEGSRPVDEKVRELEGNWRYFQSQQHELRKHPEFEGAYQRMGTLMLRLAGLKTQVAVAMADKGVKDRNPNYFHPSSGIYQTLKEAERFIAFGAFKGEADGELVAAKQALADAQKAVAERAANFGEASAAAYRLPPERYSGADKAKLTALVRSSWQAKYPEDRILAIRFPKAAWKRDSELKRNATNWYKTDVSSLVVYVVVKTSATLATVYPAYLNKDHMQGDELLVGVNTKGDSYVHEEMLIKNL
ncbi:MAG: hypothetical protein VKP62_04640 [Candidatus Sericytochromatia bacterium]|nr:hypothetical protein [Candidatus Sericytochromatia bacterium]